jgi:protein-L-isoaspartate(D-aspartate) O-methyltransferase
MNDLKDATPRQRQETMIQQQVVERGIRDARVLGAMRAVPRDRFVPTDHCNQAFADRPADIGHGQTISQPYIVALMSHRLALTGTERVLEIGTGSGYQTAVLAQLAGEVYTVERIKPLLDAAWDRLMGLGIRSVHFRHSDGGAGWPEAAPFDRVLITAGAPALPERLLLDQLAEDGIAVLPIGPADRQMLVEVRRRGGRLLSTDICPCRFVKLIGKEGWHE